MAVKAPVADAVPLSKGAMISLAGAIVILVAGATALQAQTRRASMVPAEAPPADFAETLYVDSRGCAFVRAALNGQVTWLPQLDQERQPLCGLEPSLFAATTGPGRVVVPEAAPDVAADAPVDELAEDLPADAPAPPADLARDLPPTGAEPPAGDGIEPAPPAFEADKDSPVVIIAAGQRRAEPRYTLRVIEQRGTIIEVLPDPLARSVLTVIAQRGTLFYPDS